MVQQDDEELRVQIQQADRDLSSCRHVSWKVNHQLEGRGCEKKLVDEIEICWASG